MSFSDHLQEKLARIRDKDADVHSFIEVYSEDAQRQASALDRRKASGEKLGRLAGMVVGVKNLMAVKGRRLTCGSKMLENYVAPYDAHVVERLRAEDAIIVGSLNMDEFACGSDNTHSAFGPVKNPLDLDRVPGGSSGGSAAAVAAGFVDASLGSDTGGSIRCPASFCGIVGFKPSYGRVSRFGLADMAMSFDQIGPLAPDVATVAKVLSAISGEDRRDQTTFGAQTEDFEQELSKKTKLTIGIPKEYFDGCDPQVADIVNGKIALLESAGFKTVPVSIPLVKYALPIYYLLVYSEFASAMQKYEGFKYGAKADTEKDLVSAVSEVRSANIGRECKRRILLGTYITTQEHRNAWYSNTLSARGSLKAQFEKALKECDVLAGPTMPCLPWHIGEKMEDPLQMYLADVLTVPANICGFPAGSVPAGAVGKLSAGLQFIGRWGDDSKVLQAMRAAEELK